MKGKYLLLGTNLGIRHANLEKAREWIDTSIGRIVDRSSVYETDPWGIHEQPAYLNQVVRIETNLLPTQLLVELQKIELKMGRKKFRKWDSRLIDLDILFYENLILNDPYLKIPHPEIPNRRFTLVPLAEIAGEELHPVLNKTIKQLLKITPDNLKVSRITIPI